MDWRIVEEERVTACTTGDNDTIVFVTGDAVRNGAPKYQGTTMVSVQDSSSSLVKKVLRFGTMPN